MVKNLTLSQHDYNTHEADKPLSLVFTRHLRDILHVGRTLLSAVLVVILIPLAHSTLLALQPVGVQPALALHVNQASVLGTES